MIFPVKQSLKISFTALLSNKARSFLTMLGIVIGVGAVVLIMSLGSGAQSLIVNQIKGLGSNLIGVLPGKSETSGPPSSVMGIVVTTLVDGDAKAMEAQIPEITAAAAVSRSLATTVWGANDYDTNITGATDNILDVEGGEVAQGRFFTADEEQNLARVAVLGSVVKQQLFGDSDALGQQIKIKKQIFDVIGVMAPRGKVAFQDYDDQVYIPLVTAQKLINGVNYLSYIRAKVDNEQDMDKAVADTEYILRLQHNIDDPSGNSDDFTVRSMTQALDMLTTITDGLRYFLIAMAAISLVVGGIGIMNIMLISVNERTREIGLRKAVGATNRNIIWQFLFESMTLTLFGGLIGVIWATIVSYLLALIVQSLGYNYDFIITWQSIALAISVSTLVGLVFGLYPARQASRLEPVEALSYE